MATLLVTFKASITVELVTNQSAFNPLTPMRDQDIIYPYNINTISTRQLVDSILNSLN